MNPMDIQKSRVVISKYWNNPHIKVNVTDIDITLVMSMQEFLDALGTDIGSVEADDTHRFIDALCSAIGNPALLLTEGMLRKQMHAAARSVPPPKVSETVMRNNLRFVSETVLSKMKEATNY